MAAPSRVKLTGRLADIALIRRTPTVLLGKVHEHLLAKSVEPSDRRQDIIHPSEMASSDWCPRQTYYRIRDVRAGLPYEPERFAAATLSIFDEGHTIHAKWQRRLDEMGLLWGQWQCLSCDHIDTAIDSNPGACNYCGAVVMEYAEVPMDAESDYMIVGHADGYVPSQRCLIEIKSVGMGTLRMDVPELLREHTVIVDGRKIHDVDEIWRNLDAPLAPHVRQANVYMHIAREYAGLDVDRMVFLYEYKSNQQCREFVIEPDWQVVEPLLDSAREIQQAITRGAPPPTQAHQQDSAKCQKCPYQTECWSANATDPAPSTIPNRRRLAGQHDRRGPDRPAAARTTTARPPGRRDAAGPGRRDRPVDRRADAPLPADGGLGPVRQ